MATSQRNGPAHIFAKSLVGVITILTLSFGILTRGQKRKHEFQQITSPIVSLTKSLPGTFNRHEGKMRYLKVAGYSKAFELFIGKDPGDFSPAFEQVDKLKAGDIVTVFFDEEESKSSNEAFINRLAQFIDSGQKAYFIRGNKDKYFGYFGIALGACIGVALVLLKKAGKIS